MLTSIARLGAAMRLLTVSLAIGCSRPQSEPAPPAPSAPVRTAPAGTADAGAGPTTRAVPPAGPHGADRTIPSPDAADASPEPGAATGERPYSVQLHVHGSFSEGPASIDSHSWEASDVGADVVWWSDHDFRITSFRHASAFGFEDWTEPIDRGEPWAAAAAGGGDGATRGGEGTAGGTAAGDERGAGDAAGEGAGAEAAGAAGSNTSAPRRGGAKAKWVARAPRGRLAVGRSEITADAADEGERSLRVSASSASPTFQSRLHALDSDRGLFKRPLAAAVTVHLSVFPEESGPDARALVEITLSEHAPRDGLPIALHYLQYALVADTDGGAGARPFRDGTTYHVPVRVRPGEWNRLSLPVSKDAAAGFPGLVPGDDSLNSIAVGVEARRGAEAAALFDRLRIEQDLAGEVLFEKQAEVIAAVASAHPRLTELQGVEISWAAQHLNEFSVDTRLLDYEALLGDAIGESGTDGRAASEERRDRITRAAVEGAHARGGLISYNHMFGAGMEGAEARRSPEAVFARLVATRAYGADILEVGYRERGGRSLEEHLRVWDRLGAAGIHLVGTGVSDSHGGDGQRWRTGANNFLSWIYAGSPSKADLIEGLRAGRVYFGDIVLFRGEVDLRSAGGFRMGQIVLTDRDAVDLTMHVDGATPGDSVRVVENGDAVDTLAVSTPTAELPRQVSLRDGAPTVVRFELHGPSPGQGADSTRSGAKVLSNPLTFVREAPAGGLPPARAGLDVGGAVSRRIDRFTVTGARLAPAGVAGGAALEIDGQGKDGAIELDLAGFGAPLPVELVGLRGAWRLDGSRLRLEGLTGTGRIRVPRAP